MNLIKMSEAVNRAASVPGVPKSSNGLIHIGTIYGFATFIEGKHNKRWMCIEERFNLYLRYLKTHYTLGSIAKEVGRTHGGIALTVFRHLGISGKNRYGKIYYSKAERQRILNYYHSRDHHDGGSQEESPVVEDRVSAS